MINYPRRAILKCFFGRPFVMYLRAFRPKPNLIADMTWENLIVLDGCRYNMFVEQNDIPGKLVKIISAGSSTQEWLQNNFSGRNLKDTIYVSANPYGSYYWLRKTLGHIPFYKIVEAWKDGWDEELGTVHPSTVNELTLESLKSHADKRHLIHYMQPHHPFIGNMKIRVEGWIWDRENVLGRKTTMGCTVWKALEEGRITTSHVRQAYISNLRLVLDYVKKLLPTLVGRTCITSDHGNVFGKFGYYGHPMNTPLPELIEVPWFEVQPKL